MAVSYEDIKNAMNYENGTVINWNGVEIGVRRFGTIAEEITLVDTIATSAFNKDTGEYSPAPVDFAIRFAVMSLYTDIYMPEDINERYELCYAPGLYESVVDCIDQAQHRELVNSVYRKIDYIKQSGINEMNARINKLLNMVESFGESMRAVMEQVSAEDIQKLTEAMSKFGFDENKVVQAYLEADKVESNE